MKATVVQPGWLKACDEVMKQVNDLPVKFITCALRFQFMYGLLGL